MPFVSGPEESWRRPAKRRKISPTSFMARTSQREDGSPEADEGHDPYPAADVDTTKMKPSNRQEIRTSDREELIQCIKRGERPTWVPKPNLEALCAETNGQAEGISAREPISPNRQEPAQISHGGHARLPPALPYRDPTERPPSALHSGDFHESIDGPARSPQTRNQTPQSKDMPFDLRHASPPAWLLDTPPPRFLRMPSDSATYTASSTPAQRARAPSLGSSLSSSFVMRAPTSPLVYATSSPSFDTSDSRAGQRPDLEDRALRRRTLPPQCFPATGFLPSEFGTTSPVPALRREGAAPYRTHQPHRSLTSFTYQPASSAQGIYSSRHRRLSHASEISSRQRNSMVGSFEESILRGRMSTPPSKPLDFVAQIGVLGKGDCSPKLKCPAHVSVPFPAVFYSYPSTSASRTISDDSPSPYVGTIDLEHHLKPVEAPVRRRERAESNDPEILLAEITGLENTSIGRALARQETSGSQVQKEGSKIILDGAYRVPQHGQLQVIIKNPNKTAVKLFLIPYNLEGMSAGTKTFVRQRSFSSGPILENVLSDKPIQDPLASKRVLRYLIHLKFCCPSKGKFYLYDNIRVVFANRVPEGNEKLRNEIQLSDPKYTPFVAGSRSRRPSTPNSLASSQTSMSDRFDLMDGLDANHQSRSPDAFFPPGPIPFHLGRNADPTSEVGQMTASCEGDSHDVQIDSSDESSRGTGRPQSPEVHGFDRVSTSQRGSPIPWGSGLDLSNRRSPSPLLANGDGLLSRKLRDLGRKTNTASLGDKGRPLSGNGSSGLEDEGI